MTRAARLMTPIAVAALAAIAWSRPARAASGLRADPPVTVIIPVATGPAAGSLTVHNDGAGTATASSVVAEAGCDPAVELATPGGFTLAPGGARTLNVSCAAAMTAPTKMQRCRYQVQSAASATLLEFEVVCAYGTDPSLVPDTMALDFGAVPVGGLGSHAVTVTNTSTDAIDQLFVEIDDLAGDFSVASPCNPDAHECDASVRTIASGATARVVVNCTPRSVAPLSAKLYLVSSAGTRLAAPIALTCTGTAATAPVLSVTPESIDVGAVAVNVGKATATFHIANPGAAGLKLLAAAILDGGTGAATDWAIAARGSSCGTAIPPSCQIDSGQSIDLDLSFAPRALGQRDATLLLSYHDVADRSISLPLHGAGSGPTLAIAGGVTVLDFGSLPVGTPGAVTIQLANRGTSSLTDGSAAVTPVSSAFAISPTENFAVDAGSTTMLTIVCQPPTAGAFASQLVLSAADVPELPMPLDLRCTGSASQVLVATPPAVLLGEVRTGGAPVTASLVITSLDAPVALASAALEISIAGLTVRGTPATTRATLQLIAAPSTDGSLDNLISVTPSTGAGLVIPVSGAAVTASFAAPPPISLGTFCVDQPTTPRLLSLISTGSATIGVSAPVLDSSDSPFDLALVSPLVYPNALPPGGQATITVTPKRQSTAGLASDSVVWSTDVAGDETERTPVTATFIDDGGAIAPAKLDFGDVMIQVSTPNARQVTLQNCSSALLQLDAPQVPAPFSIDSPSFPSALRSGEIATFSVGFHPTQEAKGIMKTLTITSPQLTKPLTVDLTGNGVAPQGGTGDAGFGGTSEPARTSFYACGGCTAGSPSSALAMALAVLGALLPRRRRRHSR